MADIRPDDDNPDWSGFDPAPMGTAALLKSIRARLALSQEAFAALLHISPSTLRNWEQGRTKPDAFGLAMIAVIYDDPEGMAERLKRKLVA